MRCLVLTLVAVGFPSGAAAPPKDFPWLNESARVPNLRFVPLTYSQYLTSVYTLWNLLDHIMYQHRYERPTYA